LSQESRPAKDVGTTIDMTTIQFNSEQSIQITRWYPTCFVSHDDDGGNRRGKLGDDRRWEWEIRGDN
jgi:hypothetical protein